MSVWQSKVATNDQEAVIADLANGGFHNIRAYSGMTQAGFAKAFGIPKRTVENWDEGMNKPAPYINALLAYAVLNMSSR